MMSLMCTSTALNPARSNAAAISTWPFTPCSRRMAMLGRENLLPPPCRGITSDLAEVSFSLVEWLVVSLRVGEGVEVWLALATSPPPPPPPPPPRGGGGRGGGVGGT